MTTEAQPSKAVQPSRNGHAYTEDIPAWRIQRWYALLKEFGLDDVIQAAMDQVTAPKRGPVTMEDQLRSARGEVDPDVVISVRIDVKHIIDMMSTTDTLFEFISVVCDCSKDEARNVGMVQLEEAATPFLRASLKPIQLVLGFAGSMV